MSERHLTTKAAAAPEPTPSPEPELSPAVAAIRAMAMDGLSPIPDFSVGVNLCQRTIWGYIAEGMPCAYIGRTPYPITLPAIAWIRNRRRRDLQPRRRGRPKKST
jgi:hypothetical protein